MNRGLYKLLKAGRAYVSNPTYKTFMTMTRRSRPNGLFFCIDLGFFACARCPVNTRAVYSDPEYVNYCLMADARGKDFRKTYEDNEARIILAVTQLIAILENIS